MLEMINGKLVAKRKVDTKMPITELAKDLGMFLLIFDAH